MKMDELIINVIFDAGKGTSTVQSREAIFGKELGSLPTPVRSGYAFDGWYLGDEQVTPSTVLQSEEDVRLVAHWVKKKGTKSTSLIKKQKTMIVAMVAVIVVLAIALIIVNDLISVLRSRIITTTRVASWLRKNITSKKWTMSTECMMETM